MLNLGLNIHPGRETTILCLGAHCDDIEIGCGGTLLCMKSAIPQLKIHWVVFSATGQRAEEAKASADLFAAGCDKTIVLRDFRDGFLPYSGADVKLFFEQMKSQIAPDVIFSHWSGDAHQDHRLISELTWNTFRDHLILEYEIPKYDGDMGRPSVFVPLDSAAAETKTEYLMRSFVSQRDKRWFDRKTFLGLMRIRGMESNSPSGYAEAFYARKIALAPAI
jgi:LmbE family N-acetylglucosaminyl deacetylase